MTVRGRWVVGCAALALALGSASRDDASVKTDASQRCAAARFEAGGRYTFCRLKERAKAAKTGLAPDYTKCDNALDTKWQKIDDAGCPFPGDAPTIQAGAERFEDDLVGPICGPIPGLTDCTVDGDCIVVNGIDCCTCTMGGQQAAVNKIKAELLPAKRRACCVEGRLPHICLAWFRCQSDLSAVCQGGTCSLVGLATTTTTTPACVTTTTSTTSTTLTPGNCFQDLGDAIRDTCTGLQWEKKDGADSIIDAGNLHDVDNVYAWAGCCGSSCDGTSDLCQPDAAAAATCMAQASGGTSGTQGCSSVCPPGESCGVSWGGANTTVWAWLNQVNAVNFAGHNDWRLPSQEGQNTGNPTPRELETILLAPYECGTSPCIDPIFGPTIAGTYWAGTTNAGYSEVALGVSFGNGFVGGGTKVTPAAVRAVRSGP